MTLTLEKLIEQHKIIPRFVIDIGGYNGEWADIVNKKFGCEIVIYEPIYYKRIEERFKDVKNIHIVPMAIGRITGLRKMYISEASTSFFQFWNNSSTIEEVPTVKLSNEIGDKTIDILKINCEGGEFEIINDLDERGVLKNINEIAVQFHRIFKKDKAENILEKTHEKIFDFKWQIWVKK